MSDEKLKTTAIREAVGIFVDASDIRKAIDELVSSGFEKDELGLLAGEYTVRQSLGDFYTRTNEFADSSHAPNTAFVANQSIGDTVHAYLGSLFFAGTTVAGGAVVATAAVLGGAFIAAAAGVAAVGAMGAALTAIIHESDAEHLEQQVEEGHMLLFVRTHDEEHETKAVSILRQHTPIEVIVVSAPAAG